MPNLGGGGDAGSPDEGYAGLGLAGLREDEGGPYVKFWLTFSIYCSLPL
jgi:hypothetical protein